MPGVSITRPKPDQTVASPVAVSGTVAKRDEVVTVVVRTLSGTMTTGTAQTKTTPATGTAFATSGFTLAPSQSYTAVALAGGSTSGAVDFDTA
jgi:hypothetical protein